MSPEGERFGVYDHRLTIIGLLLIAFSVALGGYRAITKYQVPGPFSHDNAGFCDFHNGLYFPTAALIEGISPYGEVYATTYPVDRQVPFFSPGFFAMHAPLAILPLRIAEVAYFVLIVLTALAIGFFVASMVGRYRRWDLILMITGLLLLSRGGQSTLYVGYFTMEIVLATLLAIHWAPRRPWLAALALVIVSAKPTYILPLGFLMLARGNYKALAIGAVLSLVAAGIPFAWLAAHASEGNLITGVWEIAEDIRATQDVHMLVADEMPVNTWTRIDLPAIVAKWMQADPSQAKLVGIMFFVLALPMVVLFRRNKAGVDDGAAGLTGLLILSAFLASIYHQSYDAMVLIAPLVGILIGSPAIWRRAEGHKRWKLLTIAGLIVLPLYSFYSTRILLGRADPAPVVLRVLTSVSGVSVAVLMLLACWMAWKQLGQDSENTDRTIPAVST
ncbi:glycosyltransferase family 87 protein [Planctomycetes bacterium K23_9]|uniref:Polyprenol-phosphate-mannose-dependent alpha-(1-2)-phosphatidylinositol mannoside mannosyltransferase n=1 Tax=Stieleria marina TaxID=1930275 RepID=A0A517NQ08_9BACT|nr:hypothetical protein K239x_11470 [Planctomycetes bacterium K23_9]